MAKKKHPSSKASLHPRNKHQGSYDFVKLIHAYPFLEDFVFINQYGHQTIDFFDPIAVKALNKALLKQYYSIDFWDIPENYLCPPIPGRVDYIHYVADLLASHNQGKIPKGKKIKVLDIGVGANCIYPLLGTQEYGWSFVGADINKTALASAHEIINNNKHLRNSIELRWQAQAQQLFKSIVRPKDYFDLSICNPPFHPSAQAAQEANLRKLKNLGQKESGKSSLNFGGQQEELWCEGGELQFVKTMILQSKTFANSIGWFTTLISKEIHLKPAYKCLKQVNAQQVKTIAMGQGNKKSRILAWTFF
ncbi:23S rRNA (adenine(1618)-N(6))-methyltransferase RlmF [Aureispira anguillae]|uniref:Ribosomal RNA large subunit methyltransferase F n=1 Tax=Aureispira anguillae TaxID=2864201 RepID=A0A915YB59_9BACT|nr:23S rRNA (adenine(1618)-N(6))-methyltransferase RlmF [Aureispira anguillae]BDS09845.1 23S rRNA (adenine(1618)-N(6))-methyltransferase RlmF [Aureispira anguillae]